MRLTQTRLLVRDFEKSFLFWRDVVGLPVSFGDESGPYASFDTGHGQLAVYGLSMMEDAIGQPRSEAARGPDQVLLGFEVEDVDQATAKLEGRGIEFVSPPTDQPTWEIRVSHLRDPDGNLVEVWGPLKEKAE
ncbi:VOC family protein [soil metagenome]